MHQSRFAGAILIARAGDVHAGSEGNFSDRVMGLPRRVEGGTQEDDQVGITITISKQRVGSDIAHVEAQGV